MHVWYTYLHLVDYGTVNVGKYTIHGFYGKDAFGTNTRSTLPILFSRLGTLRADRSMSDSDFSPAEIRGGKF